jgi:hypothetical protein
MIVETRDLHIHKMIIIIEIIKLMYRTFKIKSIIVYKTIKNQLIKIETQ